MPLVKAPIVGYNRRNYADQVLNDCPEIFYRFDEPSGSVALDRSGFGRNGTYTTPGTIEAGGRRGCVMTFQHPMTDNYLDYSAEMIISIPNAQRCYLCSIGEAGGNSNGLGLTISNGNYSTTGLNLVGIANGVQWIFDGNPKGVLQTGRNHVAFVFDSFNNWFWLFVNGVYVWRFSVNPKRATANGSIGFDGAANVLFDEFALFGCQLPHSRIYAHWKAATLGV